MNLYRRRNHVFSRIGDRYRSFIDPDHFLGRTAFEDSWMTQPVTNILEEEDRYELEIGLPGYAKDEITISVNDDILSVVAKKSKTRKDEKIVNYVQKEIETDQVERTFYLSSLIDSEKIESNYHNGLLQISLPFIHKSLSKVIAVS